MVKKYTYCSAGRIIELHCRPFVTVCILTLALLSGCTSPSIYQEHLFNPPVYFGTHIVQPGETLYRIAWRYGRDFRELANQNGISSPYIISPGQKIHLELKTRTVSGTERKGVSSASNTQNVTKRKNNIAHNKAVTKVKKHKDFKEITWVWPHFGPILAKYNTGKRAKANNQVNKGLDIGGSQGDPVLAAASGEVVYAGNGLLGYGNLVIINHNERFLSAYAHNSEIIVKEGQNVKAGQQIAKMGKTGAQKTKLHFEIRKDSLPVNPLNYLPRR